MSALTTSRYVAWRVADLAAFPHANMRHRGERREGRPYLSLEGDGRGGARNPWQKSVCSQCAEPVWFQPAHQEHRALVCWRCAGDAE